MHFLAPLWLGALAALALPVALHLLSRGRGRRVPLASTRLLETALSVRGRRLRPSDLMLLLLRCALLASLALALAEPWVDAAPSATAGSWLLVEPGLGTTHAPAGTAGDQTLARWRREAAAERFLATGLPESDPGAAAAAPDVWSLLAEADRLAPKGAELRVATRARLAELRGRRPSLVHRVAWLAIEQPASGGAGETAPILLAAGPAEGERVSVLTARGTRDRLQLDRTAYEVDAAAGGAGLRAESVAGGRFRVSDAGGRTLEIPRSAPLQVALHADAAHAASAAMWRRAFDVGAGAVGARLEWTDAPAGGALRLWLDDAPPPAAWRDGALLVTEARSPGAPCVERIVAAGERVPVGRCEEAPDREAAPAAALAQTDWLGSDGRPFLTAASGAGEAHLSTRADAAWSDLAGSSALPRQCALWIEGILQRRNAVAVLPAEDPRAVAEAQRLPAAAATPEGAPPAERRDASAALWLVTAVLLAGERLLSARATPAALPSMRSGRGMR